MLVLAVQDSQDTDRNEHTSESSEKSVKLGWLLVMSEIISDDVLELALQASRGFETQLGQVLLDTDRISDGDLENALLAQELVRKGMLDPRIAYRALGLSHRSRLAYNDAVARASWLFRPEGETELAAA